MAQVFSDDDVAAIRSATPGCRDDLVHLNHAGSSLPSRSVLDAQIGHLELEARLGGYEAARAVSDSIERVYGSIATLVGAQRSEIARMEHATAAWNAAFWSIPMAVGQRIVTHDHDYGANYVAFLRAAELHGVEIERVPSDRFGQIDLSALAAALEHPDQVALISLAWIPTSGGLINPAAAVGELAKAANVPYLLDACQAVGQLDIDVNTIGCDFMSATGRKYVRGPRGSGFLYVRDAMLDRVEVSQPDHHGAEWTALDSYSYIDGAARFEHWEYNHGAWLGLGAAVDVALELGVDRIQTSVARTANQLRTSLHDIGWSVHDEGIAKCGIVTASHGTLSAESVAHELSAAKINVSTTFAGSARAHMESRNLAPMVRFSVHCTTTADEIDRTIEALALLGKGTS